MSDLPIDPHWPMDASGFVAVRCGDELDDQALLAALGHPGWELKKPLDAPRWREFRTRRRLLVVSHDAWRVVFDSWHFWLYYQSGMPVPLEALAARYDVFCCWIGDIDESIQLRRWRGGQLVRRFVVGSPNCHDRVVILDEGSAAPGEADALSRVPSSEAMRALAVCEGLPRSVPWDQIRMYGPTEFPVEGRGRGWT